MTTVGMVGAGHMGSGLGWALREGGHEVVTTLSGRSARTGNLARRAGLTILPDLADVVSAADVVLVVTPPGSALSAAAAIAAACREGGVTPLVADLNAISPSTVEEVAYRLAGAGVDLVDGSISGPPPTVRAGARIYLSGKRTAELAALQWTHVHAIVVGDRVGLASAVKMCTASVYKGSVGLLAQAMLTAAHHDVLEPVLADLADDGHDPVRQVAVAVTKAHRFVPEMREIAATQAGAGQPQALFECFAEIYERLASTQWAQHDPESVDRRVPAADLVAQISSPNR
jgi:3-hydroxyisobutyrate dehydrogenase-like beta-hydroxyacid dehydrogenase